jgi:20S proteasome alpha/beta subunit
MYARWNFVSINDGDDDETNVALVIHGIHDNEKSSMELTYIGSIHSSLAQCMSMGTFSLQLA